MPSARPHGRFLAAEAGELAGVSGTTIGQWARRGYIRSSRSQREPRVYSVEDVAEAAVVGVLLARGVRHAEIRRVIDGLGDRGPWPLSAAALATVAGDGPAQVALREDGGAFVLTRRGWQRLADGRALKDVRGAFRLESRAPA